MLQPSVRTTCPYCGVGCGVIARHDAQGAVEISGDLEHPSNLGRLCSKGSALGETLGLEDRLLYPQIGTERVSWDAALDRVAAGFNDIIAKHGPQAVAFYVSGQLLTEDYYVANKLMKGFIGTANIDTNSRMCLSSAVAGHKRAFGEDIVPVCYEDLELADLVVLVGSNTAWCHPVIFQRILAAKQQRSDLQIVVIDPRRTATCEFADLHLPLRAGTDVWLFNGLLAYLHQHGLGDAAFIREHTRGVDKAMLVAENTAGELRAVAKTCRIDIAKLERFYQLFANTEKTLTVFSQGVNQSSAGTDKVNSIINCHLFTGRIGKPGMGPFSITGQPNAMGGREVGGLANMLAAHMELADPRHRRIVQQFWNSPTLADKGGLKAVDLFEAVHQGRIKAIWIMATNPVVSMPDADKVREALRRCELVVVSDCMQRTDTAQCAHVLLPAAAWGEKDGTVTNSDRHISRQRRFLPLPGEARPDWWIITQVAQRMGYASAFDFNSAREVFLEHARLSAVENAGDRAFNIDGLSTLSQQQFDALQPIQWPVLASGDAGTRRLLGERFYHSDRKAHFIATTPHAPLTALDVEYPLVLNTGRIRDQWHTMTRSGKSARLAGHMPEPFVDMHAQDALLCAVRNGELARVSTQWGSLVARLRISGEMPRGMIFVPIHWNSAYASDARVGALVNPIPDPISGEPELKHTPARVAPFLVSWHGFMLTRRPVAQLDMTWWTLIQGAQFQRYELAGRRVRGDWSSWARRVMSSQHEQDDWIEYSDPTAGVYRGVLLLEDRIEACLFISPRPDLPSRAWLSSLFANAHIDEMDRAGLLAGQPADPSAETGPPLCSCFGIGRKAVCDAIKQFKLLTPQQVGQKLRAGTNCGSCVPEIKALLNAQLQTA
jgi:assimilatory nitrate reductase catalytic subunit